MAQVGTVTRVPAAKVNADESSSSKEYGVTFNNGRSEYTFHVDDLILDPPPYNYEVSILAQGDVQHWIKVVWHAALFVG